MLMFGDSKLEGRILKIILHLSALTKAKGMPAGIMSSDNEEI